MDISVEIAAIQAASQGSELRQPLVDALTALNIGTLPDVTASDVGKILKVGANGWEVGEKSGYMPIPTATKQILENGTYDVTDFASAQVYVSSGGSILIPKTINQNGVYDAINDSADGYSSVNVNVLPNWRDSLSVNWDFSSPVNTRGNSSYSSGSSRVSTLDGWEIYYADLEIVSGGIKLSQHTSGTGGYFMQRYSSAFTSATVGKTITYSVLIDNQLGSETVTLTSGSGGKGTGFAIGGSYIRLFNYGSELEFTIDVYAATKDQLIKAVKFEIGNTQTLATQINGIWVLNNEMDQNTEYVKARCGILKSA